MRSALLPEWSKGNTVGREGEAAHKTEYYKELPPRGVGCSLCGRAIVEDTPSNTKQTQAFSSSLRRMGGSDQLAVDIDRKMSELTHENTPLPEVPVMVATEADLPFPPTRSTPGGELENPHYMPRAHVHVPTVGKPTEMDFDQRDEGGMGAEKKHWLAEMQRHRKLAAEKEARAAEWQERLCLRKERERKCVGCGEDPEACV